MLGLFGNPKKKLEKKYQRLLDESFRLSHTDRKASDLKAAEAEEIRQQLDGLESPAKGSK